MANLPNKTFLCNYNARDFIAATNTIPNTSGALFAEDAVLSSAPTTVGDGYLTIPVGCNFSKSFSSTENNPFNRSGNQPLTIVAKTSVTDNNSGNIFANRNTSGYNWMLRQDVTGIVYVHTSTTSVPHLNVTTTSANTYSFVIDSGYTTGVSYTDSVTTEVTHSSWGRFSSGIALFKTLGYINEDWTGDFYWVYISPEALTDAEIQQVIAYNEGVGISVDPDEINFSKYGDETEITVRSETDWTATTTDSWITISPTTGESGTSVITVSGGANRGDTTRSASIGFIDADENTAEVTIMQPHIVAEVPINKLYKGTLKLN